ncbi:Response regulator receiver domain-containing protein [Trichlorobacter thiogenes]|uniref:Response regulator receiver domain-containing protein n=1 Tax=Trichlorobacter thiogenes TaxID=115783 RepID=A0A1T4NF19_9BACT|nr:response regulator [Trichlorobacter thiogenes]SJZ77607.1 Response regulator receiver domain-containing protein [Trichlorobacter thiogenes]
MGSISILLADDSITIQKVVGIIFGSDDYTLTVVDNGKAAVQKAQELQPDVLLIDALMPGMSGYEVCEAIRKDAALASKPVLLLTGSFEPFDEDKARQCGADDHIVKPFESQQIVAKVQELYQLGLNRAGGVAVAAPEVAPAVSPVEATIAEEPFAFEQPASPFADIPPVAEPVVAFEPPAASFAAPAFEPEPVRSPDDPWGAFTQQPAAVTAVEETFVAPSEPTQPFVAEVTAAAPAVQPQDDNIGASWVPVEEQTFEFREEPAEEVSAPAAAFTAAAFEPVTAVEPVVEPVAEPPVLAAAPEIAPELPAIVPAAGAVTLTDEQLKEALMAASKETIERIVWEVVPDLAEAMIKEAIKRITEAK